jgi:DnaJ-domain-containing protein 1
MRLHIIFCLLFLLHQRGLVVLAASQGEGSLFNWNNLWQSQSYYDVLKVDELATVKEIKKAYRKMAVIMHPDKLNIKTDEEKVTLF